MADEILTHQVDALLCIDSREGRYLGHDFFVVPDQQMPATRAADEAGVRNMLGALAGAIVSSIQIVSHTQDKRRRINSPKLVARQRGSHCGVVEYPEPARTEGQEVVQEFCNSRAPGGYPVDKRVVSWVQLPDKAKNETAGSATA